MGSFHRLTCSNEVSFINLLKLKEFIMKNSLLNLSDPFFSTRFLGFDSLFDSLRTFSEIGEDSRSYPPYNIKRDGNNITIEVAVAGLSEEDLTVETKETTCASLTKDLKILLEKSYIKESLREPLNCNFLLHLKLLLRQLI